MRTPNHATYDNRAINDGGGDTHSRGVGVLVESHGEFGGVIVGDDGRYGWEDEWVGGGD